MKISEILDRFEHRSDDILTLLKEERACLKEGQPTEELLERKRLLIEQLTQLVDQVRAYRKSTTVDISVVKDRLSYVQQRLMTILQLDREVEKLFLGTSLRPSAPELVPTASKVGAAYQAAVASNA